MAVASKSSLTLPADPSMVAVYSEWFRCVVQLDESCHFEKLFPFHINSRATVLRSGNLSCDCRCSVSRGERTYINVISICFDLSNALSRYKVRIQALRFCSKSRLDFSCDRPMSSSHRTRGRINQWCLRKYAYRIDFNEYDSRSMILSMTY